jgi:hypothetical protein
MDSMDMDIQLTSMYVPLDQAYRENYPTRTHTSGKTWNSKEAGCPTLFYIPQAHFEPVQPRNIMYQSLGKSATSSWATTVS